MTVYGVGSLWMHESGIAGVVCIWNIFTVKSSADNVVNLAVTVAIETSFFRNSSSVEIHVDLHSRGHEFALAGHNLGSHTSIVNSFVSFMVGRFIRRSVYVSVGHGLNNIVFKSLSLRWNSISSNILLLTGLSSTDFGYTITILRAGRWVFSLGHNLLSLRLFSSFHLFFRFSHANVFVKVLRNLDFIGVHSSVLLGEFLNSFQVMSNFSSLLDDGIVCFGAVASCDTSLFAAAAWDLVLKEFR